MRTEAVEVRSSRPVRYLSDRGFRCVAGRDAFKTEHLERRQHATVKRGGKGGAAGIVDLRWVSSGRGRAA
jgi:hypothetical protein